MKKYKKILSVVSIITLCTLMVLTSIPFATAVKKPSAPPLKLEYWSDYGVQEHCLTFMEPIGGADGYHIVLKNASGKTQNQFYFKSTEKSKIFYQLPADSFVFWNFKKYIKSGQWYTVKARAFNLEKSYKKSYKTHKKPNAKYTKYTSYATTYACEKVTGVKAKLINNGNNIKVTWNNVKGSSSYKGYLYCVNGKSLKTTPQISSKNNNFILRNNYSGTKIKKGSKITLDIIPQKLKSGKKIETIGSPYQSVKVS